MSSSLLQKHIVIACWSGVQWCRPTLQVQTFFKLQVIVALCIYCIVSPQLDASLVQPCAIAAHRQKPVTVWQCPRRCAGATLACERGVLGSSSGCKITSAVNLVQAQAHTMDTYLPQRLQDEAAAASLARETAAAAAAPKPAKQPRVSSPTSTLPNASQANGSQAPKAATPVAQYATQASQPYVTPMPVSVKYSSQVGPLRDVQQEPPKAYKHPIESTADIGQGESVAQLEQGLEVLDSNDDEEDLEAPSSFCCPITTVRFSLLLLSTTAMLLVLCLPIAVSAAYI